MDKRLLSTKLQRKLAHAGRLLAKHEPSVRIAADDHLRSMPTRLLYVANAGVTCGVDLETVIGAFSKFGELSRVVQFVHCAYAFVEFVELNAAIDAYQQLQASLLDAKQQPSAQSPQQQRIYLIFVENLPQRRPGGGDKAINNDSTTTLISGLKVVENFISEQEELELESYILALRYQRLMENLSINEQNVSNSTLRNREVFHFGYTFLYGSNLVDLVNRPLEIPPIFEPIIDRIAQLGYQKPDQLTINIYEPGQGIPSHTDTHSAFESEILSVSLGSDIVFQFRYPVSDGQILSVLVPRCSLLALSGEARYVWKHAITPRKFDVIPTNGRVFKRLRRISLTFRKVRRQPCDCQFPRHCDHKRFDEEVGFGDDISRRDALEPVYKIPESESEAQQLELDCVHDVYDQIAAHFDHTRHSRWTGVQRFLDSLPPRTTFLLDVGCGNGKYLYGNDNHQSLRIGCDRSSELCRLAQHKTGAHLIQCDCLSLPFRDAQMDAVLSVAVIHHLATAERRRLAVGELMRMLRPGGLALITVWAFEQKKGSLVSYYLDGITDSSIGDDKIIGEHRCNEMQEEQVEVEANCCKQLEIHKNRTEFKKQDLLVPWVSKKTGKGGMIASQETKYRFYHVFKENELDSICLRLNDCELQQSWYEEGNWCAILRKT